MSKLRRISKILSCCLFLAASAKFVLCQTDNPRLPLHVEILQTPTLAVAGGEKYIVYELHLTSFYTGAITLQKIEVFGAANSQKLLFEFKDKMLVRNLKHIAATPQPDASHTLDYGRRVVLFAWVKLDKNSPVPSSVSHRLSVKIGNLAETVTMLTVPTKVNRTIPLGISPPLKGANWLAGNAPQPDFVTAHNRLLAPLFGRVRVPQRFATDWVKFGEDGKLFRSDASRNENWYGYAEPVLAVADGIVTEMTDGVPENTPPEVTTPMTAQTVAGNYVLLKIGANRYAIYAHLKPGSIKVKKGQKVKRGEIWDESVIPAIRPDRICIFKLLTSRLRSPKAYLLFSTLMKKEASGKKIHENRKTSPRFAAQRAGRRLLGCLFFTIAEN